MLRSYLVTAVRHLKGQPGYTLLNILGFTVGLTSSFLILLYLFNELSYDKHHEKADRVYRISSDISEPDNNFRWASSQMPLGQTAKEELAEVENYTRFISNGRTHFEYEGIRYFEHGVMFTDSTVFDIFTYPFIAGSEKKALEEPNTIVMGEKLAKRIFKDQDPIGKIIKADEMTLKVTGVYKDLPQTSHLRPTGLISIKSRERYRTTGSWGSFFLHTYVLLEKGANPASVEQKLNNELIKKYVAVIFDQFDITVAYEMINIKDIHLKSTFLGETEALGNIKYVYIFAMVGLFLVVIAAINYMNLATARSMKRSMEVGMRKVMGARRESLALQFILESIILTLTSCIISLFLLHAIVPVLNEQLDIALDLSNFGQPIVIASIAAILFFTGLFSGSYPAFFLSSFKPLVALRMKAGGKNSNQTLRRVLVGIQFAVSIFMLLGTFLIYQQMQYLREKDLGFDKEQIIEVQLDSPQARDKWPLLKTKLESNPMVSISATASSVPGNGFSKNLMAVENREGVMEEYGIDHYSVDYDYFPLLNVQFVHGRNISSAHSSDTTNAVIVNEAMVRRLNWENPIGRRFQFDEDSTKFHKVIGVVKDFHQLSLYNPIEAMLFTPQLNNRNALIKIDGDIEKALPRIEEDWNEVYAGIPFQYDFLDQDFQEQYREDDIRGKLFLGFSIMMILIACFGLLGLASFIAEQRTKEISIRKVLGAPVGGLVSLLVKDFLVLVIAGAIPAFALGYYFINEWLANFEYHITIGVLPFVAVFLIISLITIMTTGFHALKAASTNPADNLRTE